MPDLHLPQLDVKLPHLEVKLPHVDFRFPSLEDLPRLLEEPAPRPGGVTPRWSRCLAGALTLIALVAGFRWVDRAISRWSIGSEPAHMWAQEAAEWYQNYPEARTASAQTAESVSAQASVAPRTGDQATENRATRFVRVEVTAYTSQVHETDETPMVTASNTITSPGTAALSRDLLRSFTPGAPFEYGDKILIPGVGIYRVEDTMNGRWRRKIDLWFPTTSEARRWGHQAAYVTKVQDDAPTVTYRVQ